MFIFIFKITKLVWLLYILCKVSLFYYCCSQVINKKSKACLWHSAIVTTFHIACLHQLSPVIRNLPSYPLSFSKGELGWVFFWGGGVKEWEILKCISQIVKYQFLLYFIIREACHDRDWVHGKWSPGCVSQGECPHQSLTPRHVPERGSSWWTLSHIMMCNV